MAIIWIAARPDVFPGWKQIVVFLYLYATTDASYPTMIRPIIFSVSITAALAFTLTSCICSAQERASADSISAAALSKRAWQLHNRLPDSSFFYATQVLKIAQEHHWYELEAYSLSDIGRYFQVKEQYPTARDYMMQSLQVRKAYCSPDAVASGYNNLGIFYLQLQTLDSAEAYFELGLKFATCDNCTAIRGKLLNGIGTAKLRVCQFKAAEEALTKAIHIAKQLGDSSALAHRYHSLGNLYEKLSHLTRAEEYYQKAEKLYAHNGNIEGQIDIRINRAAVMLRNGKPDFAIVQLEQARELTIEFGFDDNRSGLFNNLGRAYELAGRTDQALTSYRAGVQLAETMGKPRALVETGINLGKLYSGRQEWDELSLLLPQLYTAIQSESLTLHLPQYFSLRAEMHAGQGNYAEAHASQLQYDRFRDSLDRLADRAKAALAEMETTQRDREIFRQKAELQESRLLQQQIQNEKQTFIWLLVVALIIAAGIIVTIRFYHKNKALADKKKSDEKLMNVLRQVDVQLLEIQMEANNATSFKIGQDLHDNLGSKLAVVQTSIEGIRKKVASSDPEVAKRFEKVEAWLEESCEDLRNIAHDLQDRELTQRTLEKEIQLYTQLINEAEGLTVHFVPGILPGDLHGAIQKEVAAIARLLIENVLRHAGAEDVTIKLGTEANQLRLLVKDNGQGFNVETLSTQSGRGLTNARLRAEKLGGTFTILSQPGLGTKAEITIPLRN